MVLRRLVGEELSIETLRHNSHEAIFYDAGCGLCARAVRFVCRRDPMGRRFECEPLGGRAFRRLVPRGRWAALPDSVIVRTADGTLLGKSAAVAHILRRLGGVCALLGRLLGLVPRPLADWAYDLVARHRHRLAACPPVDQPRP